MATDNVVSKLFDFMNEDPKKLAKKYPTVDPQELLKQLNAQGLGAGLNLGGQGAQLPGQTLGGGGPPVPGALPQGGQGFVLPQDNPFVPRNPDELNMANYAQASQPGFNVGTTPGIGAAGVGGIDYAKLLQAGAGMMQGLQTPPKPASPVIGPGPRPGGGVRAPYTMPTPPLPNIDPQTLIALLRSGQYGQLS